MGYSYQRKVALRISEYESSIKEGIVKQQKELCEELYSTNPLEHRDKDKAFARITLSDPNKIIRVRQMIYTYQDIKEFDEQIKEFIKKETYKKQL